MSVEIPGYKITRILGRGGMAKVYLATQEVFEREVALKVMSKTLGEDPNFNQRFFREAKIVSKLVHPNIVTVHDVGMHEGYCYLSMEYVDGQDLKAAVGGMTLRQKIRAVYDIAKALDYAGAKGYVHRDIKPENIMFHTSDGRAVLMDFGIARAAESDTQVTQAGTAIGTPHYMSPEQAKGKRVDNRSDIYSLGVVFFYTLAGRVPFDAESAVAIGIKHITEPIPLLPEDYEQLQPLIDRMMSKDVSKRYQNAKELMADLDALDVDRLDQLAGYISPAVHQNTTLSQLAQSDEHDVESFELDEDGMPSQVPAYDAYVHHGLDDIKDRTPIFSWLIAGLFVVGVAGVFMYFKHPELFEPLEKRLAALRTPTEATAGVNVDGVPEESVQPDVATGQEIKASPTSLPKNDTEALASGAIKRNVPPAKTVEQKPPSSDARLAALRQTIARLEKADLSNPAYLNELVVSYREALTLTKNDSALRTGYADLKQQEIDKLVNYADERGAGPGLDKRARQLQALFPEIQKSVVDTVLADAKARKKAMTLVLEAQGYLKQNNLTKPAGRNALEFYQRALSLDPSNHDAKQGIATVASRLMASAEKKYQAQRLTSALASAKTAAELAPNDPKAQQLLNTIQRSLDRKASIQRLLDSANEKVQQGQLFTPAKQGAFHDYQAVLSMDPSNTAAEQGLERVVDALSARMWQLVGAERFSQAKELMRLPLEEFGDNQRVQSLSLALEELIQGKS